MALGQVFLTVIRGSLGIKVLSLFPVFEVLIGEVLNVYIFCKPIHSVNYEIDSPIARWDMFILSTCNSLRMLYTIAFHALEKTWCYQSHPNKCT